MAPSAPLPAPVLILGWAGNFSVGHPATALLCPGKAVTLRPESLMGWCWDGSLWSSQAGADPPHRRLQRADPDWK